MKNCNLVLILMIPLVLVLNSCQESPFDRQNLLGKWKVSEWEIESTGQTRSNQMDMTFRDDGTYEVDYGSEKERGRYWIANEYLHTVEEGMSEKKVRIVKLNNDTLEYQMNRGGELERVLMTR